MAAPTVAAKNRMIVTGTIDAARTCCSKPRAMSLSMLLIATMRPAKSMAVARGMPAKTQRVVVLVTSRGRESVLGDEHERPGGKQQAVHVQSGGACKCSGDRRRPVGRDESRDGDKRAHISHPHVELPRFSPLSAEDRG